MIFVRLSKTEHNKNNNVLFTNLTITNCKILYNLYIFDTAFLQNISYEHFKIKTFSTE